MSTVVAAQIQASPAVRASKRKRTAVSYVEADWDDGCCFNAEHEEKEEDYDDDGEFGKPHKKRKCSVKPQKAQKPQKPFPFLSLPPELRNLIYSMVLTDSRGAVYLEAKGKSHRRIAKHCDPFSRYHSWSVQGADGPAREDWDRYGDYRLTPALLAASKAIYAEAAPMLYGQRFVAQDGFALMAFLMLLSPERVALLRRVAISDWFDTRSHTSTNLPAVALLRDAAPALERFEIQTGLVNRYFSYCSYRDRNTVAPVLRLARKIYRDCHPLLYAVMRARGFDAVLEVVRLVEDDWDSLASSYQSRNKVSITADNPNLEVQKYKDLYAEEIRRLMTGRS
ncbi:hypothetical protein PG993_013347 [Apiospora rasikravindrae]|uniref:DUF7730 domain-containing protein n=1 Tax=Apiospora rasikravindrae TaxID=990691 RepID=A0ABR1RYS2_9PEZI